MSDEDKFADIDDIAAGCEEHAIRVDETSDGAIFERDQMDLEVSISYVVDLLAVIAKELRMMRLAMEKNK